MKIIRPKNWNDFQHYKERTPIWIKLHKRLLDDFDYQSLPVASRALAPMLWLLASEYENGEIPADTRKIAFRLRMTLEELADAFEPLKKQGFFEIVGDDSEALAEPARDAIPEKEKQVTSKTQDKTETESSAPAAPKRRATGLPASFPQQIDFASAEKYWLGKDRGDLCDQSEDIAAAFRDHHTSKGTTSLDWSASWRTWCRHALTFNKKPNEKGLSSHDKGTLGAALYLADIDARDRARAGGGTGAPGDIVPANGHGRPQVAGPVRDVFRGHEAQELGGNPGRVLTIPAKR